MKRQFILKLMHKYDLINSKREEAICYKRYYIFYLLSKTGMGLSSIGRATGKHHASVIYGIRQHKKWYKLKDQRYMSIIKPLMDEMLCFDNDMHIIPINIKRRGVNYDVTFTLEIDKETAQEFETYTTLNQIITKFIELNTLS